MNLKNKRKRITLTRTSPKQRDYTAAVLLKILEGLTPFEVLIETGYWIGDKK